MDVGTWEVSVPVTVIIENGKVASAEVDYDGAPWPFVDNGGNVYDPLAEDWVTDSEIAGFADMWLEGVLHELSLPGVSE